MSQSSIAIGFKASSSQEQIQTPDSAATYRAISSTANTKPDQIQSFTTSISPPPSHPNMPLPNNTEPTSSSPKDHTKIEVDDQAESEEANEIGIDEEEIQSIFGTQPVGVTGKTQPRAVIRIERDYSAKGATTGRIQFWDGWVEELEGRVTPLQLQNTLNDLNGILASAYDPYRSIFDNVLSVLTFYLSPLLIETHYKKQMKLFSESLDLANRTIYNPVGLHLLHPRKVAFLFLEIEYY